MSEEKKNQEEKTEEQKQSEKTIYILTALLVFIIFSIIGIFYFNKKEASVSDIKVISTAPENINIPHISKEEKKEGVEVAKNVEDKQQTTTEETTKTEESKETNELSKIKEVAKNVISKEEEKITQANVGHEAKQETAEQKEITAPPPPINVKPKQEESKKEEQVKQEAKAEAKAPAPQTAEKQKETKKSVEKTKEEKSKSKSQPQKATTTNVAKKTETKPQTKATKEVKKQVVKKRYFFIQVNAFSSLEKAKEKRNELLKQGHKKVIVIQEKGLYKVLVGKFNSMKEATNYMKKHNLKGWIRILKM